MWFYLVLLIFEFFLYNDAPNNMDKSFMAMFLLLAIAQYVRFFIKNKKQLKSILIRHSFIFLLCYFVVFYQCYMDYIVGLIDSTEKNLWIDTSIVCKSMVLATMALSSLLLGYSLFKKTKIEYLCVQDCKFDYISKGKHILCFLGYGMLFFYLIFVPKDYLAGGYNEGVDRGWVNVVLVLIQAVFIAMFALYCYDYRKSPLKKSFVKQLQAPLLLVLLYIVIVIVTGRRTEAVRMGLFLAIVYSYSLAERQSMKYILIYTVGASIVFSVVGVLRADKAETFSEGITTVSEEASVIPFTRELAGSINTLHVAVSKIPSQVDYNHGFTFFPSFCVLVPGLDRFVQTYLIDTRVPIRSGQLITTLELGYNYSYGMGSSIVADVYVSFGPIGVVIIFILLGLFIRYLDIGTFGRNKSPYFLVLAFGCCSQFMITCRGEVSMLFLSWSYATILVYLFTSKRKNVQSPIK